MAQKQNLIILGGGQAAAYAAKEIRSVDNISNLTIISEENFLPYERPPLSKDCLLNKKTFDQVLFFPKDFYEKNDINFINNKKIVDIDFDKNSIFSSSGDKFIYNKLLIATGSVNRKLIVDKEFKDNEKDILYLRDIKDSQFIKDKLEYSKEILIIGGGFIGLEIASSASQLGKKVSVVEMGKQLMGRAIPENIATLVQEAHKKNGNEIYLEAQINQIKKREKIYEVFLSSNKKISADLIIVGIGSLPNTEIFSNTSLKIDNGILTDEFCQTSVPNVFAAGDVANFFHPFYNMHLRLESYRHAQNHGICAAKNITGTKTSYTEIPWMWSDQFNLNMQMTGICNEYDMIIQRGTNVEEGLIYFFTKNSIIMGACGLGIEGKIGRDIRLAEKIAEKKIKVTKEILSDKNLKLNKVLSGS